MSLTHVPVQQSLVLPQDPMRVALAASYRHRAGESAPIDATFVEVGRRLLLAELEFSEWILRRVEKVTLERDRSVGRSIAVDLCIRDDAPVFDSPTAGRLRLVPLSMMRRRTLVNLDIRDSSGETMTMPGLRLTQQLDQAVLLAAAAAFDEAAAESIYVRRFVRDAIAGTHVEVADAYATFDRAVRGAGGDFPNGLVSDPLFSAMVNRFRHSFTLYAFFAETPESAHRLVRISFDEPTTWLYQKPSLSNQPDGRVVYRPGELKRGVRQTLRQFGASLGIAPIRMRFQIPGAENAASYHFEITTPPGVQIASATLLAGRPNEPSRRVSVDRIVGHSPTVGLHAVEVPDGALCRVQVELRATPRGWLTSMMFATLAAFLVVLSVGYHWGWPDTRYSELNNDLITNVVVILVTASAAVATLVTQRDHGDVASRFVAGVRGFGIAAMALPAVTATVLVYRGIKKSGDAVIDGGVLRTLTFASLVPFTIVLAAWLMSVLSERTRIIEESPWDMTRKHPEVLPTNFTEALYRYGFDRPAVGVSSAEGWHEVYDWSDEKHRRAIAAINSRGLEWQVGASTARDPEV